MTADSSPFNWQGQPSVFAKEHAFNGINADKSRRSSTAPKKPFYIDPPKDPERYAGRKRKGAP